MSEKEKPEKANDPLSRFNRYLGENPAMLEIWSLAIENIEAGIPIPSVQAVVVREWLARAQIRRLALEASEQTGAILHDEELAELAALRITIASIVRNFKQVEE